MGAATTANLTFCSRKRKRGHVPLGPRSPPQTLPPVAPSFWASVIRRWPDVRISHTGRLRGGRHLLGSDQPNAEWLLTAHRDDILTMAGVESALGVSLEVFIKRHPGARLGPFLTSFLKRQLSFWPCAMTQKAKAPGKQNHSPGARRWFSLRGSSISAHRVLWRACASRSIRGSRTRRGFLAGLPPLLRTRGY